jgi:hypothetical protein
MATAVSPSPSLRKAVEAYLADDEGPEMLDGTA